MILHPAAAISAAATKIASAKVTSAALVVTGSEQNDPRSYCGCVVLCLARSATRFADDDSQNEDQENNQSNPGAYGHGCLHNHDWSSDCSRDHAGRPFCGVLTC